MDVAIEELSEAADARSRRIRSIYNIFGLVYAMLGDNAKAKQNFQRAISLAPERFRYPAQLGLVSVQQRPAARVDPGVRARAAQSVLQDA